MEHRTLCPACRHPMVELRTFDGTSSADAPQIGSGESSSRVTADWHELLFAGVVGLVGAMYSETKIALKKRRATRLRKTVLPRFPFSLVCPLCFQVVRRAGKVRHASTRAGT